MIHFMDRPTDWELMPIEKTDISEFYWRSDINTHEIADAFSVPPHSAHVTQVVGEAIILGVVCKKCSGPIIVSSRTKAKEIINALDDERSRRSYREWAHPDVCRECSKVMHKAEEKLHHEEYEREQRERAERKHLLRTMPYRDFLQTPEWQDTRKGALRHAGYRCQTCANAGKMHVHHRTYVNRGAELPSDLIVLCADCHELFHKNGKLAAGGRADTSTPTQIDGGRVLQ